MQAPRRKWGRFADDGGRCAVRERRIREPGGLLPAGEAVPGAALACPDRLDRERSGDLHRGRPAVCARDRGGRRVGVFAAIVPLCYCNPYTTTLLENVGRYTWPLAIVGSENLA